MAARRQSTHVFRDLGVSSGALVALRGAVSFVKARELVQPRLRDGYVGVQIFSAQHSGVDEEEDIGVGVSAAEG